MNGDNKRQALVNFAIIFTVGVAMAYMSWLRWPDVLVDFGRELYTPWQMNEGKLLYADIAYWNGPLSPYLNALFFKLFGVALFTLEAVNMIVIALISFFIYKIFEDPDDHLSPLFASLTFLTLFAFAQYYFNGNFNFVAPYSHELTHGTLISLVAIYTLKLYAKEKRLIYMGALGLLTGLALLTKIEITLSVIAIALVGVILNTWIDKGRAGKILIYFIAGTIIAPLVALIIISSNLGGGEAIEAIFGSWIALAKTEIGSGHFQRVAMGTFEAKANIAKMGLASAAIAGWVIFLSIVSRVFNKQSERGNYGGYITGVTVLIILFALRNTIPWFEVLRPLPLIVIICAIGLFIAFIRNLDDRERAAGYIPLIAFAAFALVMLLKIILNVHVFFYGFALAMPATLLLVKALLKWAPQLITSDDSSRATLRSALLTTLVFMLAWHVNAMGKSFERQTLSVGAGSDLIKTFIPHPRTPEGVMVNAFLETTEKLMRPDDTFVVFPEGVMLNFLTRRENPSKYLNFIPPEVTIFGEEAMLASLIDNPPDFVVIADRDTSEYGYPYFGQHYARDIYSWVARNYHAAHLIGSPPLSKKGFGILIMEKNERSAP